MLASQKFDRIIHKRTFNVSKLIQQNTSKGFVILSNLGGQRLVVMTALKYYFSFISLVCDERAFELCILVIYSLTK